MKNSTKIDKLPVSDICFFNDKEIRAITRINERDWNVMVTLWEQQGFPKRQRECGNKRFWPAVRTFFLQKFGEHGTVEVSGEQSKENFG